MLLGSGSRRQIMTVQPSQEQVFSKATTNKNSSRKGFSGPFNQTSENISVAVDKAHSPSFSRQKGDNNFEGDFKQILFNNTGTMSQEGGVPNASQRTLNLKKEISSLDQEILQL